MTNVPGPDSILAAADHLTAGRLVILPTDTVYGIVAAASNEGAVRAIYHAKGKAESAPLQLLFEPSMDRLSEYADLNPRAQRLVAELGPGGWTIIVPAASGWTSVALAGGRTVGFRIPASSTVHQVVALLGGPLAASSANRHGERSPSTCVEAVAQVGAFAACAVDGGPTPAALDSTVIDCSAADVRILREGAIDRLTVARILNLPSIPVVRSVRP